MQLTLEFGIPEAKKQFDTLKMGVLKMSLLQHIKYDGVGSQDASSIFIVQPTGGLELLCDSVKIHQVIVEPQDGERKLTMKQLLSWVRSNLIKERPEMFMKGDSVRPGVLVLVNDCDWELSGQLATTLDEKDVVVFISTLHGG